jgi:hypothetical protein
VNPDQRRGAIEAVDRLVNRGGEADEVLRGVLASLRERGVGHAAIRFVESGELVDGPSVGAGEPSLRTPVVFEGRQVGELALSVDDPELAERVATLVSAYVLVGWDTGGERWEP